MNLIYVCVFNQKDYIFLLKLLFKSIYENANLNKNTTNILIFTCTDFQSEIIKELSFFNLSFDFHILNLTSLMDSSCCKLRIFEYPFIDNYEKILYLDVDTLINSDINKLFNENFIHEKLYVLEEGFIGKEYSEYWGGQFFDFSKFDRNLTAFSAGVFYFMNSESIKLLFKNTLNHISNYMNYNSAPICLDQPFLVYNSFIENKFENQIMKKYLENNPNLVDESKIIYHFPGGPGNFTSKINKMNNFLNKILSNKK